MYPAGASLLASCSGKREAPGDAGIIPQSGIFATPTEKPVQMFYGEEGAVGRPGWCENSSKRAGKIEEKWG